MISPRPANRSHDIETNLAVRLGVLDLLALIREFRRRVVRLAVLQRPGHFSAENVSFQPGVGHAAPEAERRVEGRPHVAHFFQLFPDAAVAQLVLVVVQEDRVGGVRGFFQRVVGCFCRQHA